MRLKNNAPIIHQTFSKYILFRNRYRFKNIYLQIHQNPGAEKPLTIFCITWPGINKVKITSIQIKAYPLFYRHGHLCFLG